MTFRLLLAALLALLPARAFAESVCASVKIEIDQQMTFERQAFDAKMSIRNGLGASSLTNIGVSLLFTDGNGNPIVATSDPNNLTASFFVKLNTLSSISAVDGTGTVAPNATGVADWLIIPAAGAGQNSTVGTLYYVGATLTYTLNNQTQTVNVAPAPITVLPQPQLKLDYFIPHDVFGDNPFTPAVEPSIPFSFGVLVTNSGYDTASSVTISSAQPQIVDNKQGLILGFQILGSTVNDQPAQPTLFLNLGDIAPQKSSMGRWIMTTTLTGTFTAFNVSFTHSDNLGGALTSLVTATNQHWLVHDVLVDLPGRDNVRDFLAELGTGYQVYESDNIIDPVADLSSQASFTQTVTNGGTVAYNLTLPTTNGMSYVRLPDPFNGTKVVTSMVRSDGKPINPNNAWTSQAYNPSNPAQYNYYVNFFDTGMPAGSGQVQTTYSVVLSNPPTTTTGPSLTYIPNRSVQVGQQVGFVIQASAPSGNPAITTGALPSGAQFVDNGNGTAFFNWTPGTSQAGSYPIQFTATLNGQSASQTATITVVSPRSPASGTGQSGTVFTLDSTLTSPSVPLISAPAWGTAVTTQTPVITVTNAQHAAGRPVTYEFQIFSDDGLTNSVTDATGIAEGANNTTSWTVDTPLSAYQSYIARVRAADGSAVSRWIYTKFLVTPAGGVPTVPLVSWPPAGSTVATAQPRLEVTNATDPYGSALTYVFSVYSDAGLTHLVTSSLAVPAGTAGTTAWTVDTPLSSGATYYWQVTASDAAGNQSSMAPSQFVVSPTYTAPPVPVAASPAAGAIVSSTSATLSVTPGVGGTGASIAYQFQIDTLPTFDSLNQNSTTIATAAADGSFPWVTSGLFENTQYYWRARATDGTAYSAWTPLQTFTTARLVVPPAPPVPRNPGDLAWVQTTTPTLIVAQTTGADASALSYDFEIYADSALSQLVQSGTATNSRAWKVPQPLTAGYLYYWHARAKDSNGHIGDWMVPARFGVTTNYNTDPLTLDIVSPASPLTFDSGGTISVAWANFNPDAGATLSLYYHSTPVLIASGLEGSPGGDTGTYTWNVSGVPAGSHTLSFQMAGGSQTLNKDDTAAQLTVLPYPTFLTLCSTNDATAAPTIHAIEQAVNQSDCQKASAALLASTSLNLSSANVSDLRPLYYATSLTSLVLDGNPNVTSLSLIAGLSNLATLSAAGAGVPFNAQACPTSAPSHGVDAWCAGLAPTATPTPTPSATPTLTPAPTLTPVPTATPTLVPAPAPSTPTPVPASTPTANATPTAPPTATGSPTPSVTPNGTPTPLKLAVVSGASSQALLPGQAMSPVTLAAQGATGAQISVASDTCGFLALSGNTVSGTVPGNRGKGLCSVKFTATDGTSVSPSVSIDIQVATGSGFYAYCANENAPADIKATVNALLGVLENGSDCATADAELLAMTSLTLTGAGITNLAPLSGMKNLVTLNLGGNAVSDLTPLEGLRNLRTLALDNNTALVDISPLGRLRLRSLSVAGDPIGKDITHCPFPTLDEALDRFCGHFVSPIPGGP